MLGFLFFVELVVLVAVVRLVAARSLIFLVIRFVAFVVGFIIVVVRLVLSSMEFFVEAFPMMGVDVMCKGFLVCPPHIPYGLHWTPMDSLHSQVY